MKKAVLCLCVMILVFGVVGFTVASSTINETCVCTCTGSAGPLLPGVVVNDATGGSYPWQTPQVAALSDNVYSTTQFDWSIAESQYLKATDFGFEVPLDATITGIKVEIEKKASSAGGDNGYFTDGGVYLAKNGWFATAYKGDRNTPWPVVDTWFSYGGPADLWGVTWTPADVNNAGFGMFFFAEGRGEYGVEWAKVDALRITVYYRR